MRWHNRQSALLSWAALLLGAAAVNAATPAAGYRVAELKEPAPEPLAAELRAALGKSGYRVTDESGKVVCDVWLRSDLPILEQFQEQLELKYPIAPGTLLGAIRYPAATSDYRKQSIKPGVYTLRYGHQPQDGNHIGTAVYRDFAVVLPASEDKSPDLLSAEKAMDLSKKTSGTTHPAILSLLPAQPGREQVPTMARDEAFEFEILVVKTSGKQGAKTRDLQIELVVVGHAPE
jgi:hypothetical protein